MANPTWWKRRSAIERGLILLCIALIIGVAVLVPNSTSCDVTTTATVPAKTKILPFKAEAFVGRPTLQRRSATVKCTDDDVCLSPRCIHTASMILNNMDPDVEPCYDFYKFACGGFQTKYDGTKSIDMVENVDLQLRTIIEAKSEPNELKPFTLVKNLYRACMNKSAIESQGLAPLQNMLKKLGGWPVLDGDHWLEDEFDWKSSMYKFLNAGYRFNHFIDLTIDVDPKNRMKRIITLGQASLGLSREYLTRGFYDKAVQAYYRQMVDIAGILGAQDERARTELKESLLFEMELAKISLPNENHYNPITLTELTKSYSSVPWKEYFSNLLPSTITVEEDEVVIVKVPSYIAEWEKLMAITPKRVQANYIMWRAADDSVEYLNDFNRLPRWNECVKHISRIIWVSVSAMYVRKYFNGEDKKEVVEMLMNIRNKFSKVLKQAEWMDEKTRQSALDKAASMSCHVAYPDELLDDNKLVEFYKGLEMSSDNYLGSILNCSFFNTQKNLNKLREPVNKNDWVSQSVHTTEEAFYMPMENNMRVPARMLQGAFFNKDQPKYVNYGAIGFVIGHEIAHGFDDQGRQFDKDGNLTDWWTPSTNDEFIKRAKCFIHQYENYTAEEVGLNVNGINTLGENIADNSGVKAAYLAYNDWVSRNEQERKLPGLRYSPRQMFWISAAYPWCEKCRPLDLKNYIQTNTHSPSEFRIIGSLSNMPEFSKDFNCPIGSKMNPEKKCSLW